MCWIVLGLACGVGWLPSGTHSVPTNLFECSLFCFVGEGVRGSMRVGLLRSRKREPNFNSPRLARPPFASRQILVTKVSTRVTCTCSTNYRGRHGQNDVIACYLPIAASAGLSARHIYSRRVIPRHVCTCSRKFEFQPNPCPSPLP